MKFSIKIRFEAIHVYTVCIILFSTSTEVVGASIVYTYAISDHPANICSTFQG